MVFGRLGRIARYTIEEKINKMAPPKTEDRGNDFADPIHFKSEDGREKAKASHQQGPQEDLELELEYEYYANLEVPQGADFATIKASYRSLMKQYHPDRFQNKPEQKILAQEITSNLNRAYRHFETKNRN